MELSSTELSSLTLYLYAPDPCCLPQFVLHAALDLPVVETTANVEDLVVETVLANNLTKYGVKLVFFKKNKSL